MLCTKGKLSPAVKMQKLAQEGARIPNEEGSSIIFLEVEIRLGKIVRVQLNTCKISLLDKYFL